MPTGYTAMLDAHPRLSTAKWVTEGLSRAFGICVSLRDHDGGLTEEQIEEYLAGQVEAKYEREKIAEAEDALRRISEDPDGYWPGEYASMVEKVKRGNARNAREAKRIKKRHEQAKRDLTRLRDSTGDEITRKVAEYGLDQLKLTEDETRPFIMEVLPLEGFKALRLANLKHDLEYYRKSASEGEARERERLESYRMLRREVARILSNPEAA